MSVFTSLVVDTITLPPPADPGTTVTIRKLAPGHLRAAQRAAQLRAIEELRAMGGPGFLKEIQAASADGTTAEAVKANPLMLYDTLTLLQKGIVAWTLGRDHNDVDVLEDLDEETQEFLARAVLKLARPSLFQTKEEQEAAQKNG